MTDQDDNGDPLLVRPYLLGKPGEPAPRASAETWPESAAEPAPAAEPESPAEPPPAVEPTSPGGPPPAVEPTSPGGPPPAGEPESRVEPPPAGAGTDATVVIVAPGDPVHSPPRRRRVLLAASPVLVLAGAATLVLALRPGPSAPRALPGDLPLPGIAVSEPAPSIAARPAAPSPTTARTRTTGNPDAQPATTPRKTSPPVPSAAGSSSTSPEPSSAPATLSPVPEADRVGTIGAGGGLCLDVDGALPFDGTSVQVFDCNNSAAQRWTLGTDGTLRALGMCARADADQTVHITYCDGSAATQWRAGPDESLVNVASNACLTGSSSSDTVARISDCTGASAQHWDLP